MYMRSSHAADATAQGPTGNLKSHINSKLVKASRYSSQLVDLLQAKESKATVEDVVEAKAYHASMRGAVAFERHNWEDCLQAYCLARMIYSALIDTKKLSKIEPVSELQSGTIDQNIRYAAHQLKIARTTSINTVIERFVKGKDDPQIRKLLEEAVPVENDSSVSADAKSLEVPESITWRSRTVPLEDASIAQAIAITRAAEVKLSGFLSGGVTSLGKRATAYDDVLVAAQDAVDATKAAIDELGTEGVPQHDRRMQALQITRTAVNYDLIGWRIGRNRVLCGPRDGAILEPYVFNRLKNKGKKQKRDVNKSDGPSKPLKPGQETTPRLLRRLRERTVLYDGILQSFDSIKDLPGVAADSSFISELEAKRSYFAALRCLAIARGYNLLRQSKNALALFARAEELVSQTESHSSQAIQERNRTSPTALTQDITSEQVSSLLSLLASLTLRHRALVEMHNVGQNESSTKILAQPPLIERLNEWPKSGKVDLENLVKYPPVMECVPVKPIFLDLAWNYVQYPGAKDKSVGGKPEAEAPKEEKKSRGWFGFGR